MPKLSVQLRLKPCPYPSVSVTGSHVSIDSKSYEFDHIYTEHSTFHEIFQNSVKSMLESFFQKYDCCIMCYGQTGSGKTYTMGLCIDRLGVYEKKLGEMEIELGANNMKIGHKEENLNINNEKDKNGQIDGYFYNLESKENNVITNSENNIQFSKLHESTNNNNAYTPNCIDNIDYFGIVPDSIEYMFTKTSSITLTFIEIYNEEVIDLLTSYRTPINLRQSKSELNIVSTSILCTSKLHTVQVLKEGIKNRIVRSTKMNLNSSRSHAILTITANDTKFTFVDLAGSERLKRLDTTRIKETISINSGLLALSNVITALAKKSGYVPFRDSKLTRVLKGNLVNCNTLILACIAGDKENTSESLNTLKYAHRAMNIDAVVKKNVEQGNKELLDLRNEIMRLKYENDRLKQLLKLGCNQVIVEENARVKNENEELKNRVRELEGMKNSYEELKKENDKLVHNAKRAVFQGRQNSYNSKKEETTDNIIGSETEMHKENERETLFKKNSINENKRLINNKINIQDRDKTPSKEQAVFDKFENQDKNYVRFNRKSISIDYKNINTQDSGVKNSNTYNGYVTDINATNFNSQNVINNRNLFYDNNVQNIKSKTDNKCFVVENNEDISQAKSCNDENLSKQPADNTFNDRNKNIEKNILDYKNMIHSNCLDQVHDTTKVNFTSKIFPEETIKKRNIQPNVIENPFIDDLCIKERNYESYSSEDANDDSGCKIPVTPMKSQSTQIKTHSGSKKRRVTFDLSKNETRYIERRKKKFNDVAVFSRKKIGIDEVQDDIFNIIPSDIQYHIESIKLEEPFMTSLCLVGSTLLCGTLSGTVYKIDLPTKKTERLFKESNKVKNMLVYNNTVLYSIENKVKFYSSNNDELHSNTHYDFIKVSSVISCMSLKKDFLCIGTESGHIHIYDLRNSKICFYSEQTHPDCIKSILSTNDVSYIGSTDIYMLNSASTGRISVNSTKMFNYEEKIVNIYKNSLMIIKNDNVLLNVNTPHCNTTGCALINSFLIGSKQGIVSEYVFEDKVRLINMFNVDSNVVDIVYDKIEHIVYIATMKREVFVVKLDR